MPLLGQNMFFGDTLQVQGNRWSEPLPGANGRKNRWWAVEGIGGASHWGYEKLRPYFEKIENAVAHSKSEWRGHKANPPSHRSALRHGHFTYPFPNLRDSIEKAVQKLGLRFEKGINDPVALAMGYFDLDTAIDKRGKRISTFSTYLNKTVALQRRDRLTVCTGAVASRLDADAQTGLVSGVHIRCSDGSTGEFFVVARREVIICSSAACTPQLLLLSGVGPRRSSEKFGIPVIKELPAVSVSATLSDHYSIETIHILETIWGLLDVSSMSNTVSIRAGVIDKGTMRVKNHDEEGRDNLDASLSHNVPDLEVMSMPSISIERPVKGHSFMSIYPTLVQLHGSGRVELAITDSLNQPRITYPLFTDKRDVVTARLAIHFAMRLADELLQSDYPYPAKLAFAPGRDPSVLEEWEKAAPTEYLSVPVASSIPDTRNIQTTVIDEEIDVYMRRVIHTSLHFSGTCLLSNDEKSGVVDQELRAHDSSNLDP
ncbi:putative GMC oxidoreductase [Annulohypoxylon moriforme]|nr:putative GMC oxidoreductase [Annulohypoxylon moriforme]